MDKVKLESGLETAVATVNIKKEANNYEDNNKLWEIKHEPELVIEAEFTWVPENLEDEQQEYYHEYRYNDSDDEKDGDILHTIKPDMDMEYEQNSIEYIDENGKTNYNGNDGKDIYDKNDLDDSDLDSESFDMDVDCNGFMENLNTCQEYAETSEDLDDIASGSTKPLYQQRCFSTWLYSNYIQNLCPICGDKFRSDERWQKHIINVHKDLIDNTKSNYYINKSEAICKQCNKYIKHGFSLLIHSMRHSAKDAIELFICNICQFKSSRVSIQKHIIEEHPDIVELYQNFKIKPKDESYECPSCLNIYDHYNDIRYHFIDKHPKEYSEAYTYSCHLCKNNTEKYDNVEQFYKHLLEEHNFNNWKLMNFNKISTYSDKQHFSCKICFKVFTEMDLKKFVRHYLEHESNSFWSCKTCKKKFSFKLHNVYHMCSSLFNKYRTRAKTKSRKENKPSRSSKEKKEILDCQDFEEYIKHVCPFCNKEFENLQNWQMHLRKTHHLDTLKGLNMKQVVEDSNKLQCNLCTMLINNKSVELHAHRFQHLPYKPYKCRHCSLTLTNYKKALTHVVNKCREQVKQSRQEDLKKFYEIICPLCNQKFPSNVAVLKHYSTTHNNFRNFYTHLKDNSVACNICQRQLCHNEKLYRCHVLKHFDQKSHKCLKCSQSFSNNALYKRHAKHHFATPTNKEINMNCSLTPSHIQEINDAEIEQANAITLNEFSEFITFACPECNENLTTQQLWLDHINDKHDFFNENNLSIKDPLDGSYKCIHCQLKIKSGRNDRRKHKLTHMPHKPFICNICYHSCNSLGVLYQHLRRIHFAKGSYKCPICSEVCTTKYDKSEHIKIAHPKSEWPKTMCLICYKIVVLKSRMKVHMRIHDKNQPKFECENCGFKCIRLRDFNVHKARHESAKEMEKNKTENDKNKNTIEKDAEQEKNYTTTQSTTSSDINMPKHKVNKRKVALKSAKNSKKTKNKKFSN